MDYEYERYHHDRYEPFRSLLTGSSPPVAMNADQTEIDFMLNQNRL
jgi:hypothetical protein